MKKIITLICAMMLCSCSYAQNITLDLKDAPVRSTIEMIFKQANIKNYVIDNSVAGFITMTITEQPFENSLKLIMRANTIPLTYTKENDVYIVKTRTIEKQNPKVPDPFIPNQNLVSIQKINLIHIDPVDLISVLGDIILINSFNRQKGNL